MGCRLVDVRRLAAHSHIAEEPAGMRLIAASCVGTGDLDEAPGKRAGVVYAADEE